ncbi:MAG: GNAT family N-acetyltransferase [Alphaproteobacteria bacterium]|nr:GNAT family N-acetyltransferase [Alphaproteobacteria bacterium]
MAAETEIHPVSTSVEWLARFAGTDLEDLCCATEEAIVDGNGFGWLKPPPREKLEAYWRGVLLVPERELVVARYDGTIVGSAQLVRPPANNEAQAFAAMITTFFVAPHARGHGLARGLLQAIDRRAAERGFEAIELNVRDTQKAAIALYESHGFVRWATKQKYAKVDGKFIVGHYYVKEIMPIGKTALERAREASPASVTPIVRRP